MTVIRRIPRMLRSTSVLRWLGGHELATLLLLLGIVGGVWAFAVLAGEVAEGETHAFDRAVLLALREPADRADPLGPRWLEESLRDFTALGGVSVLTLVTVAAAGFLILQGRRRTALLLVCAIVGGWLLSQGLKAAFDRPRPDLVPRLAYTVTASFPSGHAMMSAVTYLTLGALLARTQARARVKAYLLLLAMLLALLVGVSRVYLGVHWPTDVLAGWTLGTAWALAWWLAVRALQRRGALEPAPIQIDGREDAR